MTTTATAELYTNWFKDTLGSKPWKFQLAILLSAIPLVINKARQIGITTTISCLCVAYAGLRGRKCLIYSNNERNAKHIVEYAQNFIDSWKDILPPMDIRQKQEIIFNNGGEIRSFAASPATVRGYPSHLTVVDEFAWFTSEIGLDRKMRESVDATLSQLGGRTIYLSTPNGTVNEFAKMWREAVPESRMQIHWSECPSYDIRQVMGGYMLYRKTDGKAMLTAPMPEASYLQEYCNEFLEYVGHPVRDSDWERAWVDDSEAVL